MTFDENLNSDEQRPTQQSFVGSLRRDTHWKCLVLTLLTYTCVGAVVWCRCGSAPVADPTHGARLASRGPQRPALSACAEHYVYIPVSLLVVVYLCYLAECWRSHTRVQLQCKVDARVVYARMRAMREAAPHVWWRAICYHYVRRTRHVTRYRNGDAFTTTRVHYERVNSHSARVAFDYAPCGTRDLSKPVAGLDRFPATKVRLSKGFSFVCARAAHEYDLQRAAFFRSHARRDDYMEASEGMELSEAGFRPTHVIAFADAARLPWYVSQLSFWGCSALLLSWPLRVLIEYRTARLHYHVHKLFGINYLLDETDSCMSRTVTVGSASDIERHIRDNSCAIAPSYSEAILMDGSLTPAAAGTSRDTNGNITASVSFPYRLGMISPCSGKPRRALSHGYVSTASPSTAGIRPADGVITYRLGDSAAGPSDRAADWPPVHRYRWTDMDGAQEDCHSPAARQGILSYMSNAFFPSTADDQSVALLKHKRKRRCLRPAYTDEPLTAQDAGGSGAGGSGADGSGVTDPLTATESPSHRSQRSRPSASDASDDTDVEELPPSYEAALSMRFLRAEDRRREDRRRQTEDGDNERVTNVKETTL